MIGSLHQKILFVIAAQQAAVGVDVLSAVYANRALDFIGDLKFHRVRPGVFGHRVEEIADSLAGWLDYLRENGLSSVWLSYSEERGAEEGRILAGFAGGGGDWTICTALANDVRKWGLSQSVIEPRPDNDRIWRYAYYGVLSSGSRPRIDFALSRGELLQALTAINALALELELNHWSENYFRPAISGLDHNASSAPEWAGYAGLGIHEDRKVLLSACSRAWVFGGMGSWNDYYAPTDALQARYDDVSTRLFSAIIQGILAGTNDPRTL